MKPLTMADAEAHLARCWATGDAVGAAEWERWVNNHDPARQSRTASLGGAALWYAQQGLHVFPLRPGSKEPYPGSRGCKDATSDPQRVADWWAGKPDSNIGVATGHLVNVVDIDGPVGNVSLAHLLGEHPDALADSIGQVLTPRAGGRHIYMPAAGVDYGNAARIAEGIDYRGRGGYVVAPPSRTEQGTYRWLHPLTL